MHRRDPTTADPPPTSDAPEPIGARADRRPEIVTRWFVTPLIVLGAALMVAYAVFRLGTFFTPGVFWPTNLLLFGGEVIAIVAQLALVYDGWRLPAYDPPRGTARPAVDLLVPVYSEPIEVLRPTLAGALGQDYDGSLTIWLLDDGDDDERRDLAAALGVRYVRRAEHSGAKAGNLNHALPLLDGELVTVLDCDMVPQPDYVSTLVPYFEDPEMAVVQTPHGFYNGDSFQHFSPERHDQSLFYDVLQWGKTRHGAAYWCGTGGMLRTSALREVGGIAEETITEDFHTSVRLHAAGWRSGYHPVALSFGLGPTDHATFAGQRDRWGAGNVALLRTPDSPLRVEGLTVGQRLSYLATLVSVLAGLRRILFVVGIGMILATARIPFHADIRVLAPLLVASVAGGFACVLAIGRGRVAPGDLGKGEILALPAQLAALRMLVFGNRRRSGFNVTSKDATVENWRVFLRTNPHLLLLTSFFVVAVSVGIVRQLAGIGLQPVAAWLTFGLAVWEGAQLAVAWRFGLRYRQRRQLYRVTMDGRPARVHANGAVLAARLADLSPGGASVELVADAELGPGDAVAFSLDGVPVPVPSTVVRRDDRELGLRFREVPPASGVVLDRVCYVEGLVVGRPTGAPSAPTPAPAAVPSPGDGGGPAERPPATDPAVL